MPEFIIFLVGVAMFFYPLLSILTGFSLYRMGKNNGIPHSWIAFIPFFQIYIMGNIAGDIKIFNKRIPNPGDLALSFGLLSLFISKNFNAEGLLVVIAIIILIIYIAILDKLFWKYKEHHYNLSTLLSIFFPILLPIFLFAIRNNKPIRG